MRSISGTVRGRRGLLALICFAFLARGLFYCVAIPAWEGFDEWAHFACIEYVAQHHRMPSRADRVPDDVAQSLLAAPLAHEASKLAPGSTSHARFWKLPETERHRRLAAFRALKATGRPAPPSAPHQYEAQQPPLYYFLMSVPYALVSERTLAERILILRMVSVCLAVPLLVFAYRIARLIPVTRRMALVPPLLLAGFPGLFIDVCRVGNDCLVVTLGAAAVYCAVRLIGRETRLGDWLLLGSAITLCLLTKSYFLVLVPLPLLVAACELLRRRAAVARVVAALVSSVCGAGWWYWLTWQATGTLSGEQLDAATAVHGVEGKLAAIGAIDWLTALDAAVVTHLWTGGWSFLTIPAPLYWPFKAAALLALAGAAATAAGWWRRRPRTGSLRFALLAAACGLIWFIVVYDVLVLYQVLGASIGIGYYAYAALAVEAVLLPAGFAGAWGFHSAARCAAVAVVLAIALDVYTLHYVSIPFYTGFAATWSERIARLGEASAACAPGVSAGWFGYAAATALLIFISAMVFRQSGTRRARG